MSSYVNVRVEDLNISDLVKGQGKLIRDVVDHETLEGFVTAVFERKGMDHVKILRAKQTVQVRIDEED